MSQSVWLIPFFPLLGFVLLGLLNRALPKSLATLIGCGSVLASFVVSVLIFLEHPKAVNVPLFDWISAGSVHVSMSFLVDALSSLFLLIITGIGFLIHVYSVGYMSHDDGIRRFFAYLNLFIFFMLLLVLGDNYLVMFIGWEGVGLCSYLLIGFWFKNIEYSAAAKKAFIMNRIGDLGLLLGVFTIFAVFGSVSYQDVLFKPTVAVTVAAATTITLLLFVGAMGKSAQIPLYTWLPDAMAGPTPVSALIHAATMVTAGIYLVARSAALFNHDLAPITMDVITWVGLVTSLLAASIGFYQNDIKKVLAYSTVSQLGLMFVALGVGATTAAVFHVMTHAFFKALLFLGAGSVIHAMSDEQDIRVMGGLRKHLPITHFTFLLGYLAIIGFPFFSGFYSKDEILVGAWEHNKIVGALSIVIALMTAFYMSRVYFLTFWGNFRGTHEQEHHLHESPLTMTVPLIVLAALSAGGGFFGFYLHENLTPLFHAAAEHADKTLEMYFQIGVTAAVLAIAAYAYTQFVTGKKLPKDEADMGGLQRLVFDKYRIDELYNNLITKPIDGLSSVLSQFVEKRGIDGGINGIGSLTQYLSNSIRSVQTGSVDVYFFAMVLAIVLMLVLKTMI
jgi:NADH-quinone oxidoreductase subunit L